MSDNPFRSPQTIDSSKGEAAPKLDGAVKMLQQTRPWVRSISVLMFFGSALMIFGGVFMMLGSAGDRVGDRGLGVGIGLFYFIMSLFYIAPAWMLWNYAQRIARFERERTTDSLAAALEAQKSFWMFVGIVMLIGVLIYVGVMVWAFMSAAR